MMADGVVTSRIFLGFALFASAIPARAQVNVEPLRHQISEDGAGARLRVSLTSLAGNTQGVVFGGAALVGGRWSKNLVFAELSGDYAAFNGTVSVAKWFVHVRHNYELGRVVAWEEFGQMESDRFRRVQLRELIGTGPRFTILEGDLLRLHLGSSYMFEHTEFDSGQAGARGEGFAHRFNNYVSIALQPDPRVLLTSVLYAQPRFDQFSDFRLLSVSGVGFQVTKVLRSRIDCTLRYESFHPRDIEGTDLELKSGLELVF